MPMPDHFTFSAVWIGLGVLALFEGLSKLTSEKIAAPVAGVSVFSCSSGCNGNTKLG